MTTRFNIVIALAGAVVVVAGQAFSSGMTSLTFGVSVGVLALAGVAQRDRVAAVSTRPTAGIRPGRSRPDRRSS